MVFAFLPPLETDFYKFKDGLSESDRPVGFATSTAGQEHQSSTAEYLIIGLDGFHAKNHITGHNSGGYATMSFVPTLGTMILGLIAGHAAELQSLPGRKPVDLLASELSVGNRVEDWM